MASQALDLQQMLPSLAPPSGKYAHLTATPGKVPAYCGWSGTPIHMNHGTPLEKHCPCGTPICPTCLAIEESWINSGGAWEGA